MFHRQVPKKKEKIKKKNKIILNTFKINKYLIIMSQAELLENVKTWLDIDNQIRALQKK